MVPWQRDLGVEDDIMNLVEKFLDGVRYRVLNLNRDLFQFLHGCSIERLS